MIRILSLAVVLALTVPMQVQAQEHSIEFCATVSKQAVPLGLSTTIEYYIWNRGLDEVAYSVPALPIPYHYPIVIIDYTPPTFTTLRAGEFVLHSAVTPLYGGFTAELAGEYAIPVTVLIKTREGVKELTTTVGYELVDEQPPERYVVKSLFVPASGASGEKVLVSYLDDSAYREQMRISLDRLMTATSRENIEARLQAQREWYETPFGHEGFGAPDDWTSDIGAVSVYSLFLDLESLIEGSYRLDEVSYRIRYEVVHEARKKYGLSPYFAVKQAIFVFREHGRDAALTYLSELDTKEWNCVDVAIREYVMQRISAYEQDGKPRALVYDESLRRKLRADSDGRLRLVNGESSDPSSTEAPR